MAEYHAGMGDAVRIRAQEDFMSGRAQMIVATNAFGMGIDKPDIRFVAHYQMPGSIEAYYQEIGRAGRDDLPSDCVLLFNYVDKNTHDFFIEGSYPDLRTTQSVYDSLVATGLKTIELSTSEIARRAGASNEMAVNSSLYLLERAGHIERGAAGADLRGRHGSESPGGRRPRVITLLDIAPTKLRVNPNDVAGRAALDRRKLREILNFCYTDYCFRAHILDYFGDRHHARQCGTCGNCAPRSYANSLPAISDTLKKIPTGKTARKGHGQAHDFLTPRAITEDETLRVRKILACATRMKGRFGKHVLAATLRGSAAKNVLQAHLNQLSTYGLLKDMKQDDILLYIDALVAARCLRITPGEYPMVLITELGDGVMRERESVELALPEPDRPAGRESGVAASETEDRIVPSQTVMETFALYRKGISLEDIASRRNCTARTVEGHLADCVRAGFAVDVSQFVSADERAQIQKAIAEHGTDKLRPIRDALPESITYTMIRFVIAEQQRDGKLESQPS